MASPITARRSKKRIGQAERGQNRDGRRCKRKRTASGFGKAAAELWGRESDRTFSVSETSRAGRPASPNAARREVYSNKEKRIDLRDFSRPIPPFSPEDFCDPSSEENDKTSFLLIPGGAQRRAGPSPGELRRLWESRTVGSVVAAVDRLHTRGGADVHVFRAGPEVGPQVLMMYCSASRVVTPPVYILYKSISYRCGFNPARALSGVRAATTVTHSRPASSLRVRLDPPDSCKTEDAGENHSAAPANHSAAPARCRPRKQAAAANSRAGSA